MNKSLQEALFFYGVTCNEQYYISSGQPILRYPKKAFRIDFYAFCICLSGTIDVEIDTQTYHISNNGFLILAPSTYLKYRNADTNFKMKVLFFEKNFLLKNISNPFIIEKMNLFRNKTHSVIKSSLKTKNLLHLLLYLEEKTHTNSIFKNEIIRTVIFNILLECAEILNQIYPIKSDVQKIKADTFLRFKKLVERYILEHHSVDFYAKKLHVSNKYLIEIVKKACGKTPHQIIDEVLLKEAYILLGNSSLNIAQISDKLLFNSNSAFGRFFKKHTSITPSEYRKKENLV